MTKNMLIITGLLTLLAMPLHAQTPTTQLAQALTAESLLDQIETKADTIKTYQATLRLEQIQGLLGDKLIYFGKLFYVSEPQIKFAVDFQTIVKDGQLREQKHKWIYDGIWLVERIEDKKQFFKRQVHAPPKPGITTNQPDDHMTMENNPFPIPLQAKKAEVLKRFEVSLVTEKSEYDPTQGTFHHLMLKPKPSAKLNFTQIDLWYDAETLLPVKCLTVNSDSDDEQIYSLFKASLNAEIAPEMLSTSVPTESGWHVEVTPLKQSAQ